MYATADYGILESHLFCSIELGKSSVSKEDFAALFQHHRGALEGFFRKRGFGEDSRDMVQQTFVKAMAKLNQYRAESSLEAWLFSIARNLWKNQIRDEQNHRRILGQPTNNEDPTPDHRPDPLDQLLHKEFQSFAANQLAKALKALPLQMRQCVVLRVYQELKYKQIAAAMNLEIGTIKSHLNQAKRKLEPLLEELNLHWKM